MAKRRAALRKALESAGFARIRRLSHKHYVTIPSIKTNAREPALTKPWRTACRACAIAR
jgi:hypothetical protein